MEITEKIVCHSDEYATDITDILKKTFFARSTIAFLNQSLRFRLMWNHDILDLWQIFGRPVRKLW